MLGRDLPTEGGRLLQEDGNYWLDESHLSKRYLEIAAVISAAGKQKDEIPYNKEQLDQSAAHFRAFHGYLNVIADILEG